MGEESSCKYHKNKMLLKKHQSQTINTVVDADHLLVRCMDYNPEGDDRLCVEVNVLLYLLSLESQRS